MRTPVILVIAMLFCGWVPQSFGFDGPSEPASAALGGAIGGILGNQVGAGQGRTAATVAGAAAGTVIASGCRVTGGTVLGGLLGGLLGSQIGGGNGRNAMAGVGAAIGAYVGSDCSPVAKASLPAPMAAAPIRINGLSVTPMTGFPLEAFGGIPPITTPPDVAAAGQIVRELSAQAHSFYQQGDTESALLALYWAKRVAGVALAIVDASQRATLSAKSGRTASVPARALVILPAFDVSGNATVSQVLGADLHELLVTVEAMNLTQGIQVADNSGLAGVLNALQALSGTPSGGGARPVSAAPAGSAQQIPKSLQGFPEGQVLRLPDGSMILKTPGALTIYNPAEVAASIPLDQLDFVPRVPPLSQKRIAAAPYIKTVSAAETEWFFRYYAPIHAKTHAAFRAPNTVVDDATSRPIGYVDEHGIVTASPSRGLQAYRSNAAFHMAMDLLDATDHAGPVLAFEATCNGIGQFYEYQGQYANLAHRVCFDGHYPLHTVVKSKTFYVGEPGQPIRTMEILLQDQTTIAAMTKALADGQAVSDLLSFTPGLGNFENAAQCAGTLTLSQRAAVMATLGPNGLAKARDAGWQQADADEWDLSRVATCLGVLPGGNDIRAVGRAGKDILAALGPRAENVQRAFRAFESPSTFAQYIGGVRSVEDLIPGNGRASGFVKSIYDGLMSGQNMAATAGGAWHFAGSN